MGASHRWEEEKDWSPSLSLSPISISISIRVGDLVFLYWGYLLLLYFGLSASTYAPSFSNYRSNYRLRVSFSLSESVCTCLLFTLFTLSSLFWFFVLLFIHLFLAKQKTKTKTKLYFYLLEFELWVLNRARFGMELDTSFYTIYHLLSSDFWVELSIWFGMEPKGTSFPTIYHLYISLGFSKVSCRCVSLKYIQNQKLVEWGRSRSTWIRFFSFGEGQQ